MIFIVLCILSGSCFLNASDVYRLDFKTETAVIAPSLFLGSYSLFQYQRQTDLSRESVENLSISNINFFDRPATQNFSPTASKISDFILIACLIAPFALNLDGNIAKESNEVNFITAETFMFTASLVSISKTNIQRKRPYVYNENVDIRVRTAKASQHSFFSAHTALAFSGAMLTAKMIDDFYPDKNNFVIYATAATTASVVGYLRYKSGKHFPTDIIVGAIIGTGAALLVPYIHKNDKW